MSRIEVAFTVSTGWEQYILIQSGELGLDVHLMERDIVEVDLFPLADCADLHSVDLSGNKLRAINLEPLSNSPIESLTLYENKLREIDLSPLASCQQLKDLWIFDNMLEHIDLAPLRNCRKLTWVSFAGNNLTEIDVSALGECPQLRYLALERNQLARLDITRLFNCPELVEFHIDPGVRIIATSMPHEVDPSHPLVPLVGLDR
ncbi:leucine-rich repeat domain-containing protein [Candidatus Thorarchaeota archaeon]|nr:MAG: leucine-rich repeat domain-containing protein [Candidatus Thorarchaeota archaeon]